MPVHKTVHMQGIMGTVNDLPNPVKCTKVLITNNPWTAVFSNDTDLPSEEPNDERYIHVSVKM